MAKNLDARDDRRVKLADLRRNVGFLKHAVHAIPDAKLLLERLYMNVGRTRFQRLCS